MPVVFFDPTITGLWWESSSNTLNVPGLTASGDALFEGDAQFDNGLNSSGTITSSLIKTNRSLVVVIDGGGSAITTGIKAYIPLFFTGTITGWTILADVSGSIVIDVWKDTYANYPPTVADTIAGTEKPTLSGAIKNQDLVLSTWTTTITSGDILAINVDSAATVTRVTLEIQFGP